MRLLIFLLRTTNQMEIAEDHPCRMQAAVANAAHSLLQSDMEGDTVIRAKRLGGWLSEDPITVVVRVRHRSVHTSRMRLGGEEFSTTCDTSLWPRGLTYDSHATSLQDSLYI